MGRRTSIDHTPFDPDMKATESCTSAKENPEAQCKVKQGARHNVEVCCHNHTEIEVNVDAQCCRAWNEGSRVSPLTPVNGVSLRRGEESSRTVASTSMCVTVNVITGGHVATAMETCRDVGMGIRIRVMLPVGPWRAKFGPLRRTICRLSVTAKVFAGVDMAQGPLSVLPAVHYIMNGISTDLRAQVARHDVGT